METSSFKNLGLRVGGRNGWGGGGWWQKWRQLCLNNNKTENNKFFKDIAYKKIKA